MLCCTPVSPLPLLFGGIQCNVMLVHVVMFIVMLGVPGVVPAEVVK